MGLTWIEASSLWIDEGNQWSAESDNSGSVDISLYLGVDASTLTPQKQEDRYIIEPWNPYQRIIDESKKRKKIKLICNIGGEEYKTEKITEVYKVNVNGVKVVVRNAQKEIELRVND